LNASLSVGVFGFAMSLTPQLCATLAAFTSSGNWVDDAAAQRGRKPSGGRGHRDGVDLGSGRPDVEFIP